MEYFLGFILTGEFFSIMKSMKVAIKSKLKKSLYIYMNSTEETKSLKNSLK